MDAELASVRRDMATSLDVLKAISQKLGVDIPALNELGTTHAGGEDAFDEQAGEMAGEVHHGTGQAKASGGPAGVVEDEPEAGLTGGEDNEKAAGGDAGNAN